MLTIQGLLVFLFLDFLFPISHLSFPVELFRVCMYECVYVPQGLQLSVLFLGFFFLDDLHLLSPFELLGLCLLACFRCFSLQLFLLLFLFFCFLFLSRSSLLLLFLLFCFLSLSRSSLCCNMTANFCSIFLDVSKSLGV